MNKSCQNLPHSQLSVQNKTNRKKTPSKAIVMTLGILNLITSDTKNY